MNALTPASIVNNKPRVQVMQLLEEERMMVLGDPYLDLFLLTYVYHCSSFCLRYGQIAAKRAAFLLVKPLADHSGHTAKEGDA